MRMRFSILKYGLLALVAGFAVGMVVSSSARGDTSDTTASASSAAIYEDPSDGIESGSNIQLRSVIEVDGSKPEITLGDLIIAHGLDDSSLKEMRAVRLADTPGAGESRAFTAVGLEQVFRPYLHAIEEKTGDKIGLRVPARVTVVRKSFRLKPEEVEAAIKIQLKTFCVDCEFEITGLNVPLLPTTVSAGSSWHVRMNAEMPKGSFSVPLEVINDDASKRTYWLTGTLAVRRLVPVTSRSVMMGERLQPEDFTMQSRDVTFSSDTPASELEITASVTSRQIAAGQIVWRSGLRRELALKAGDGVKVVTGNEAWQISVEGIAQSSGYVGDTVRVKIPRTQKILSGLLRDKGVVEVQ
jgi:flagella basal body P-ring formation protein FlgA